jgi:hypothetical protein
MKKKQKVVRKEINESKIIFTGRLNKVKFGISLGILFGIILFFFALTSTFSDYGSGVVAMFMSIYGIFDYQATIFGAVLGLIYGFIDGFIFGFIFSWIYNKML